MNMKFFAYQHLPQALQVVSIPVHNLAVIMEAELLDSEEKEVGMRKLLEAKDCFVRAKLQQSGKE